ncbi:MAG: hypothetical protein Q9208_001072 [Pyrenodesmia sp. 3 TL-2023]
MSRRTFDVGLDVDRIKKSLKFSNRSKNNRSLSISHDRPKTSSDNRQLVLTPRLKQRRSSPSLRPEQPERSKSGERSENGQSQSLSPEPATLPASSPITDNCPQPQVHSLAMNGNRSLPDEMDGHDTPSDDAQNFDLKPPAPRKPVQFLETYSEQLFSDAHLRTILRDPSFFLRFTAFLNRYKPHATPILIRYLEAEKAIKAVEYANSLAEDFKPLPGDTSSQIPCAAATIDPRFESRFRRATEMLLNEALPAYITQSFTKVVTESMVREITGTTMPIMRELVGGLAEVFCLSDPSMRDNPIVYASEEFYRTTQYGRDYVIGRNCRFLQGPKTDRNTVARIKEAVRQGQESFETILNYRRDGSPFMNLVMTAPLYDNKGTIRYFIGAQVDITGLVEEGRGLDSLEKLLNENRRNRNSVGFVNQKNVKALSELGQLLSSEESSVFSGQGHSREGSVNDSEYGGVRSVRGIQRDPNIRQRRRVLGNEDEDEQEKEKNAWAFNSMGPSGKLPGVYQNYLLLRPHPSLRIIFVSPALRIPGLLQSPFLSRIGGPPHVRQGLASAFANGEDITAKVTWLPQGRPNSNADGESTSLASRPGSDRHDTHPNSPASYNRSENEGSRTRYISCTPLLGSDDKVGVWMVVMVENETVTGSLPSRANAITRYGSTYTNHTTNHTNQQPQHQLPQNNDHPPTPSAYNPDRDRSPFLSSNNNNDTQSPKPSGSERLRSPPPEWRGLTSTPPNINNTNGAKRFHTDVGNREKERGRMYAPPKLEKHNVHRNLFSEGLANGVSDGGGGGGGMVSPPAGTGRVLLSDDDEDGEGEGMLNGVGDPGTGR